MSRPNIIDRIAELAGTDVASKIVEEYRGWIYIKRTPGLNNSTCHDLSNALSDKICAEFTGDNHSELAERFSVSVQYVYRVIKIAKELEAELAKQAPLDSLIDLLKNSASMLTLDDIHYITVQVTLAWQHPVALLSRLQQIGAASAARPDAQPAGAAPAPEHPHPTDGLAPPDAAPHPQSGAPLESPPLAPSVPDDLS